MKVKDAIEKLSKLPQDYDLLIEGYDEWLNIDFVKNKYSEYDFTLHKNRIIDFVEVIASRYEAKQ